MLHVLQPNLTVLLFGGDFFYAACFSNIHFVSKIFTEDKLSFVLLYSANHGIIWKGSLKVHLPALSRDICILVRVLRAWSGLTLNVSRDMASTANLCHCFTNAWFNY